VAVAFSGGPDSTALLALAMRHGLTPTAHHVDHQLRPHSGAEAEQAAAIAGALGCVVVIHRIAVAPGPNLEARARDARRGVLPPGALTGHTADDQAETVLLRLLRGSGAAGLSAIEPGPTHPLLALRRSETHAVADAIATQHGVALLADVAQRDVVPLLTRTADLLRGDEELLARLSAEIDPTDAKALAAAEPALARRAVRRWLTVAGYPPDAAAVERVLAVARGLASACELPGGARVTRTGQRLSLRM
jgi:tRNA(Ile)-lysidine synthase